MVKKIWFDVHSTYQNCGVGIFTVKEMTEAVRHTRVGGFIYDAHFRNKVKDLPINPSEKGVKYFTNLGSSIDNDYVEKRADFALNDLKWLQGVGHELVGYFGHEFGVFKDIRGRDFLVPLMKAYRKRGILTVFHPHTVLKNPEKYGSEYRGIMEEAVKNSDLVLGMSPSAINMLESIYGAPRENMMLNWHGVDAFSHDWVRPELKQRYIGDKNCKLTLSGGFFSRGKLIDEGIKAHVIYEELTGNENWKYLVIGYHKDPDHVKKCFEVAKKLGTNPIIVGDGKEGDLELLAGKDFSKNKVIFYNVFATDEAHRKAKVMADRIDIFNESDTQTSSGELVSALASSRISFTYSCPIAEDLEKEGAGFSVERTPEAMAESMAHVEKNGNESELELAAARVATRFYWRKPVSDMVDAVASIIDNREKYKLEGLVS